MQPPLLDDLVGAHQKRLGDHEIHCPGGFEVDDKLDLGGQLDRDVGGLRALENLVDVIASAAEQLRVVRSVRYQSSAADIAARAMHGRQPRHQRERIDLNLVVEGQWIADDIQRLRAAFYRLDGGRDVVRTPNLERGELEAELAGRRLDLAHAQHGGGIV